MIACRTAAAHVYCVDGLEITFTGERHMAFYGQREFGVRDPNGVVPSSDQAIEERAFPQES
ncbi:MAG: hypothetical protein ACODAE_02755 [Gemmatimonadota bacterium]